MNQGRTRSGRSSGWPLVLVLVIAAGLGGWAWSILGGDPAGAPGANRIGEARNHLASGRAEAARELLEAIGRPDGEASWLLSRAALQRGDVDRAIAARDQAIALGFADDPMRREPSPFVGADRCAACHPTIALGQRSSNHARSLRAAAGGDGLPIPEAPLVDPDEPAVSHRLRGEPDGLIVETETPGGRFQAVVDWLVGSGRHATTPVGTDVDGQTREIRLSHYADGVGWDLTTGHPPNPDEPAGFLGRMVPEDERQRCLNCHATNHLEVASRSGPTLADGGIGCERCHGPGGNHVAAVDLGFPDLAIVRPKAASAEQVVTLCGDCHRPQNLGGPPLASDDPLMVRFQAATMVRSACSSKSPASAKFDCITCHDPHRNAESGPEFYEAICLSCHSGPGGPTDRPPARSTIPIESQVPCPVDPARGCVDCHMPRRTSSMRHTMFTDHHIRIPQGDGIGPGAEDGPDPR